MGKSKDIFMNDVQKVPDNLNKTLYKMFYEEEMPQRFWEHNYNSHTGKKDKAYTDKDFR